MFLAKRKTLSVNLILHKFDEIILPILYVICSTNHLLFLNRFLETKNNL